MQNVIRTRAIELSIIPAIAYKTKLPNGGAGIKLLRLDTDATAVATLDKRTGDFEPYGSYSSELFPYEAFDEALELLEGLPYSSRGAIRISQFEENAPQEEEPPQPEKPNMVNSDEYKAILDRYCDEKGKLNYSLMNKDFIQFAAKSKTVANLVANREPADVILHYVVKSRAALIAGKKEAMSDDEATALIETLDEIDPRSAFKELKAHINKMLARGTRGRK